MTEERERRAISRNDSPDIGFSQAVNTNRGCEHCCVYCFARPTHAYLDLSPGLDFETRLYAKTNAAERLRNELAKPGYRREPITLGINTDAYQPIEGRYAITRQLLQVLSDSHHPVGFVTKGAMIERDLDPLANMACDGLIAVHFSVTTLDNHLGARMEPTHRVPTIATAPNAVAVQPKVFVIARYQRRENQHRGRIDAKRFAYKQVQTADEKHQVCPYLQRPWQCIRRAQCALTGALRAPPALTRHERNR